MGDPGDGAGTNVLCVPEFTFYEKMFPFDGFRDVYQGQPVGHYFIMFSHNGQAYDEIAASGATGLDPNLVKGLPVKLGQRVLLLLPPLPQTSVKPADTYRWMVMWRVRNLFDFRNARNTRYNYSLPLQGQGVADTTGPHPGPRVVIPAANQTIVYNQAEPVAPWNAAQVNNLRVEQIENHALVSGLPLLPNGEEGTIQQGVLPSTAGSTTYRAAVFAVHELQAVGDELLLALTRSDDNVADWDFEAGGADFVLGNWFAENGLFGMASRGISP